MTNSKKGLAKSCKKAVKAHSDLVCSQVASMARVMMARPTATATSSSYTLMELIILRDIASANEQAWAEQRLLYEQLIADFDPPA